MTWILTPVEGEVDLQAKAVATMIASFFSDLRHRIASQIASGAIEAIDPFDLPRGSKKRWHGMKLLLEKPKPSMLPRCNV
jgi:hypothetical protein